MYFYIFFSFNEDFSVSKKTFCIFNEFFEFLFFGKAFFTRFGEIFDFNENFLVSTRILHCELSCYFNRNFPWIFLVRISFYFKTNLALFQQDFPFVFNENLSLPGRTILSD